MPVSPLELEAMLSQANIPGASIATLSSEGTITTQTAGIMQSRQAPKDDSIEPEAINDKTTFEAASLSKPVFAYIVLKMIQGGKFDRPADQPAINPLDRPLYEIAPFGPPELREEPYKMHYESLTARMVLSHQSGLPNQFPPLEYLAMPGTRFDYSGEAFCFLMDVIIHNEARLQGLSKDDIDRLSQQQEFQIFEQGAQKEFAKIGMAHSSFIPNTGSPPVNRATGHNAEGVYDTKPNFPPGDTHPGASLVTTAEDYAKFLQACVKDKFICETMFAPEIELADNDSKAIDSKKVSPDALSHLQWGLGIGLQTTEGGSTIAFHWGDNYSYRAFTAINLTTHEAAVCLTNSTNGPRIFRQATEHNVGNLDHVSEWLSGREDLEIRPNQPRMDSARKIMQQYKSELGKVSIGEPTPIPAVREEEVHSPSPFKMAPGAK